MLTGIDKEVKQEIVKQLDKITLPQKASGGEYIPYTKTAIGYRPDWYLDKSLMEFVIMLPEETWRVICSGIFLWPALPE